MSINVEDLTKEDGLKQGDTVYIRTMRDAAWFEGQFVNENTTGVVVLDGDRLRFFPWANVETLYKNLEPR